MRLDFGQVWINPVADLANGMAFEAGEIEHDPAVTIRTDAYAAGNYRAVRSPGRQRTAKVALPFCTDAQVAWFKDQQGELCVYRDPRGEKFAGIYADPAFAPRTLPDSWAVTLTVFEVTWSEEAVLS